MSASRSKIGLWRRRHLVLLTVAGALGAPDERSATAQLAVDEATAPRFERAADVERVLPQSSVYDMLEDRVGFLWFATREGLARWDGYQVRTWKHDPYDDSSLPGNVIRRVLEDGHGDIWVDARNYLDQPVSVARIQAPDYDSVTSYGHASGWPLLTQDGEILVADRDAVYRYERERDELVPVIERARPGNAVALAETTRDGTIWIGAGEPWLEACTPAEGCRVVPFEDGRAGRHIVPRAPGMLYEDPEGTVWIGPLDTLAQLSPERDRIAVVEAWEREVGGYVSDIVRGPDGIFWILGERGVVRHDPTSESFTTLTLETLGERTQNTAPTRLLLDRAGTLWVASVYGIYRHDPGRASFGHIEYDPQDPASPSAGLVVSLLEDSRGALWIGTIGGGLNRLDRTTGRVTRFRHDAQVSRSLGGDTAWALAEDAEGRIWAAGEGGLSGFDEATRSFEVYPIEVPEAGPVTDHTIAELATGPDGELWATCLEICDGALLRFDPTRGSYERVELPPLGFAGYFSELTGDMFLVGSNRGLFLFEPRAREVRAFARGEAAGRIDGALAFHVGRAGDYWVGANTGLYRFGPDGEDRGRYTDRDGLPSSSVYGILEDRAGRLWLSTNRGLAALDPRAPPGQQIRLYDLTTGLRNREFNRNAAVRSSDGVFFFGGDRGITYLQPDSVRGNPYRPPIAFTALHRSSIEGVRSVGHLTDARAIIAPDDYTFTLEFAALSYRNSHQNRYRVVLEGFDPAWTDLGTQNQATYTNVPPGRYTFRVRAANNDGLWNDEGASVDVVVQPWIWQTTWFRVVAIGLVIALVAFVATFAARLRYREQLSELRAAQALERERSRISRDMHDEVGANLTEIAILSEIAKRQRANGPTDTQLEKIAEKSRGTLDSIAEIVWAIDPVYDDGDRFSAYLREYVAEHLEATGVAGTLDFPPAGAIPRLSAEFRRAIFLVLKEALTNAAKHSDSSRLDVDLRVHEGMLGLRVRDDGGGFNVEGATDSSIGTRHHGLRNMRERAQEIGGVLTVTSHRGGGAIVALEAPLPSQRESSGDVS